MFLNWARSYHRLNVNYYEFFSRRCGSSLLIVHAWHNSLNCPKWQLGSEWSVNCMQTQEWGPPRREQNLHLKLFGKPLKFTKRLINFGKILLMLAHLELSQVKIVKMCNMMFIIICKHFMLLTKINISHFPSLCSFLCPNKE